MAIINDELIIRLKELVGADLTIAMKEVTITDDTAETIESGLATVKFVWDCQLHTAAAVAPTSIQARPHTVAGQIYIKPSGATGDNVYTVVAVGAPNK